MGLWGGFTSSAMAERPLLRVHPQILIPTQKFVGMAWVHYKMKRLKGMSKRELDRHLREDPEPVVIGPEGRLYLVDGHHEAMAVLLRRPGKKIYVEVVEDWSHLDVVEFHRRMIAKNWFYVGDEIDEHVYEPGDLPKSLPEMLDAPYRSLASFVRKAGGCRKCKSTHSEFTWARALRKVVPMGLVQSNWEEAIQQGVKFARSSKAEGLPGYISSCEEALLPPETRP
ncbi:MAG: ParB-like protein [Bdellovibrionales bacterium]